jgi:hypothetical protein
MTGVERVFHAINHREADQVPKGEWFLGPGLIGALLGKDRTPSWEDEAVVREMLDMDLVVIAPNDPDHSKFDHSLLRRWRR